MSERERSALHPLALLLAGLPGLAGSTLSRALGLSGDLLAALRRTPEALEQLGRAGRYLADLRETAGLTRQDLARAIDLSDPELLRAVEEGRMPVNFDLLWRLAAFYARNDPVTFVLDFSRQHAPWLWQALRLLGLDQLVVALERELRFVSIYRARESARKLSEAEFERLLAFVKSGFDLGLDFLEANRPAPPPNRRRRKG